MGHVKYIFFPSDSPPTGAWWFPVVFDDQLMSAQSTTFASTYDSYDSASAAIANVTNGSNIRYIMPFCMDADEYFTLREQLNFLSTAPDLPPKPYHLGFIAENLTSLFGDLVPMTYTATPSATVTGTSYAYPSRSNYYIENNRGSTTSRVWQVYHRTDWADSQYVQNNYVDVLPFTQCLYRIQDTSNSCSVSWRSTCIVFPESYFQNNELTFPQSPRFRLVTIGCTPAITSANLTFSVEVTIGNLRLIPPSVLPLYTELGHVIYLSDEPGNTYTDPYDPGGNTSGSSSGDQPGQGPAGTGGVEGGDGTHDWYEDSTPIDFNPLPTVSAVDTGFVTLLNPTETQLKSLASFMWSDLFSLDTLKKIFADPMELILGLNIVPVDVPQGSLMRLKVAGFSTGLDIYRAASQYVTVDCGSITLQEYWGAYLDYAPYTKVNLYLPYIGIVPLSTDDVMHRAISIKYKVDILTGACMAQIKCTGGKHCNVNSVMYQYTGNCAINIPVSSSNFAQTISALIGVATTAVGLFTAGSATAAAVTAGQATQAVGEAGAQVAGAMLPTMPMDFARQNQAFASAEATVARGESQVASAQASRAAAVERAIGSTASYVMNAKPTINRTGSISGTSGIFGIQKPYLIVEAPRQSLAANYNSFVGYPSNINEPLSALSGFTSFEKIYLRGIPATDPELAELYTLLKNGVIF